MKAQIILHITELLLAIVYLVIKWPFYEGDEYFSNFVLCAVYIILLMFYCSISALVPAMKLACEFYKKKDLTIKKILISQIPWFIFVSIIAYLFHESLGLGAVLPIALPNIFLLAWEFIILSKNR